MQQLAGIRSPRVPASRRVQPDRPRFELVLVVQQQVANHLEDVASAKGFGEDVFEDEPEHDSARAIQIRLRPFSFERLVEVGQRVRAIFPADHEDRITQRVDDAVLEGLAKDIAGNLGGKVGIAPRVYLKRLVDVLDKVDQSDTYDPSKYKVRLDPSELSLEERAAAGLAASVDDIPLDLEKPGDDEGLG